MSISLQENIRNIIFYYVKQKYCLILKKKNKLILEETEINDMVNNLYVTEKSKLQNYIRECLKELLKSNYNCILVESIIFEIFDDEELAKNRIIMEINNYQRFKKEKNNIYELLLTPHHKYGIGLKLDFDTNEVVISNFKRNPDNNDKLPAEDSNKILIGDNIISINDIKLEDLESEECIRLIKEKLNSKEVKLLIRSYQSR